MESLGGGLSPAVDLYMLRRRKSIMLALFLLLAVSTKAWILTSSSVDFTSSNIRFLIQTRQYDSIVKTAPQ